MKRSGIITMKRNDDIIEILIENHKIVAAKVYILSRNNVRVPRGEWVASQWS